MTAYIANVSQRVPPSVGRRVSGAGRRAREWVKNIRVPSEPPDPPDTTNITSMFTWCRAAARTSRPHYLWSVLAAAKLARDLGIERISAIRCGVAGGNGLLALESVAQSAESLLACYFDDIFGLGWSDFNGERAAITEFNQSHSNRKVGPVYGLKYGLPRTEFELSWPEKIFLAHIFDNDRYADYEGSLSARWYEELRLSPEEPPSAR